MRAVIRYPSMLAAVAAALALGACGGSNGNGAGASNRSQDDTAFEGALKLAKCMREHGIDAPDPQREGNGGIKQTLKVGANISDAKLQAARKACQKYTKTGGGLAPSAAEQAKIQDATLAYAKCMRQHGVDVPDPKVGEPFRLDGPGKPNPDSPAFKQADKACHFKLDAIG